MDKLDLLTNFEKVKAARGLRPWEVRLYILFIVSSKDGAGEIQSSSIRSAFGRVFMSVMFPSSCRKLINAGLIEIAGESLESLNNDDFSMKYKLLPLKGMTGEDDGA